MQKFTVDELFDGERADVFVANKLSEYSRSSLSRLFRFGEVSIRREKIKPSHRIKNKDIVSVNDWQLKKNPSDIKFKVLYEDTSVIVIDKPTGILSHAKGALNDEPTVASGLRATINPSLIGNRAGIVHRLDRGTSGVMVVAKNKEALDFMQKQFSKRLVAKIYIAVVSGAVSPLEALIDVPVGRNPKIPQTFIAAANGKPAQTHYKVLKTFVKRKHRYSLLELKPVTGRTHQLRVHLSYIGHPIVGDVIYGTRNAAIADTMLLCAKSISIKLPSGKNKTFSVPLPLSFKKFMKV